MNVILFVFFLQTGYDDGYEGYTDINAFNPYQFEVTPLSVSNSYFPAQYSPEARSMICSKPV